RLENYQCRLEQANESLSAKSQTDSLTGLDNRAAFDRRLDEEFHRAQRHGHPLSLLLLDVDHFKSFNDEFGHSTGDAVLQGVARLLSEKRRAQDMVARFGGEEFAVVLPDTNTEGAVILAERFRRAVESESWADKSVTISAGVATLDSGIDGCRGLIDAADQALYAAKNSGRNCVIEAGATAEKIQG
ncbi:MAG: GGDEF domain-containing protein, partial [Acidobacteriota bacterium]|nr:GGDEF domain-containing protein [Acidobacteriota bacterium]